MAIHVLDDDHGRRAQIARCAYALGHHAEVYSSPSELAAHAPQGGVIVALEDVLCDGISGLMGLLNREGRWLAVIATSSNPSIAKAVQAIEDGALNYVALPFDQPCFARLLEDTSAEVEIMRGHHERHIDAQNRLSRLSPREREVLSHMAEGLTNKEIGRSLAISPRTVEIHRTNSLKKLSARHSSDGIRLWVEAGKSASVGMQATLQRVLKKPMFELN